MADKYDTLLVLGCGIDESGILIDDARSSVELAVDLFKQHLVPLLIFSGGYSYKASFAPPTSEGQAMKDYAVTLGVPAENIQIETESKDTLGNAYFSKVNILGPLTLKHVAILRGPNQSEKRVSYIFGKVLGEQYHYELIKRSEKRPEEQERERKSLVVIQNWLKNVDDGDDGAIYEIMREKHPAYSNDPKAGTALQRELDEA